MNTTKKLFSNSAIVFVGTIIGSIFSYLFNMLMGRMLGPEVYGEMSALMSVLMIVAVGGGAVLTVTMRYTSELYAKKRIVALKKLYIVFTKYILFFSFVLFLIGVALSGAISQFFHISSTVPVIIILSAIVVSFVMLINRGILQGTQKFVPLVGIGIVEMVIKLAFGVILVKLGFGLNGAVSALVLSVATVYLISIFFILPIFKEKSVKEKNFRFDKKEIVKYSIPTLLVAVVLATLINLDIILIKHYFSAEDAGLYAAISTIAKIIFYLLAPIVSVMFPMISEQKTKGNKHYKIFLLSIFLTILGGLIIMSVYTLAPGFVIKTLYGESYTPFYYLLPEVGLLMLFYTLINLIANYYMAIKNFFFLWISIVIIISQIIIAIFWHPSVLSVVRVFVAHQGLLFVIMLGYYLFTKREQIFKHLYKK